MTALSEKFFTSPVWDKEGNNVTSPLGAWLLLSLLVGSNTDALTSDEKARVELLLGSTIEAAYGRATALLSDVPEDVAAAAAAFSGSPLGC